MTSLPDGWCYEKRVPYIRTWVVDRIQKDKRQAHKSEAKKSPWDAHLAVQDDLLVPKLGVGAAL